MNERDPLDEALSGLLSGPIVGWASQRCESDSTFCPFPDHKIEACRKNKNKKIKDIPGRAVPVCAVVLHTKRLIKLSRGKAILQIMPVVCRTPCEYFKTVEMLCHTAQTTALCTYWN